MSRLQLLAAAVLLCGAAFVAGAFAGSDYTRTQLRNDALEAAAEARAVRDREIGEQSDFNQARAGEHAAALAGLNTQLGDARAHIATLSTTRRCLGGSTAGVLNAIGKPATESDVRPDAGDPARAAAAVAGLGGDAGTGYVSERTAAEHIATCRAWYAELESQVNGILDIEDRRDAARAAQ